MGLAEVTDAVQLPKPWERQPNESDHAWLCFCAYRDMHPSERLLKRAGVADSVTKSKWYREHNWSDRCKAYDDHMSSIVQEERETMLRRTSRELAFEHSMQMAEMRDFWLREFAKYQAQSRESEMPAPVKFGELLKLGEMTVKLQRLLSGETTENVGTTDLDFSKLSLEELRTLHELTAKAKKDPNAGEEGQ